MLFPVDTVNKITNVPHRTSLCYPSWSSNERGNAKHAALVVCIIGRSQQCNWVWWNCKSNCTAWNVHTMLQIYQSFWQTNASCLWPCNSEPYDYWSYNLWKFQPQLWPSQAAFVGGIGNALEIASVLKVHSRCCSNLHRSGRRVQYSWVLWQFQEQLHNLL